VIREQKKMLQFT